ncbi:MAG: ABC transporter ATP-binding protein [Anaerolineales bacterium]|nr:ABC transporter ATP-binding protein [Anaerolineales bacterium]
MPLLEMRGLTKHFGGLTAVNNLDLRVEQGEIVSLIGPNGAGKTTIFNLITGLYPSDEGDIIFEGQSLLGLQPHQITAQGIARTFQTLRIFVNMTVLENVMVAQHSRSRAGVLETILRLPGFRREEEHIRQKAVEALSFFGTRLVGYRFDQLAYSLSYANRRRLEIARAMAAEPKLLLLDEPTAGMNPHETQEMTRMIGQLRDEKGYTILFIEHDMKVVEGVSDRVAALDYGCKIAEGTYEEVAHNERVIEAYLGRRRSSEG